MTDAPDREDWTEVLLGHGQAFGRIFNRHHDRVRRQASRFTISRADVDDVVAIVFLELWRRRGTARLVDGSLAPWLLVTAANTARHQRRSRLRYERLLASLPPPDVIASPGDRLDDLDVEGALRRLSPGDQQILTLCVLEGFSERAAAEALGVPPGTVKSRLHRAKRRLAELVPGRTDPPRKEIRSHEA